MRRTITYAALVAILLLAGPRVLARAQSGPCSGAGCPDSVFGTNGILRLPSFGGAIGAIAIQNIGGVEHIVALNTSTGSWKLTRYHFTSDGAKANVAVDTTFGTSGVVTKAISGSVVTASQGMIVQPDHKLVVVGNVRSAKRTSLSVLTVVRYMENGQVDTAFGNGGTVSLSDWSTSTAPRLQSDGKILLAIPAGTSEVRSSVVVRLDQFGQLDTSFDEDGIAVFEGIGSPKALAVQWVLGEEKIVLATYVYRQTAPTVTSASLVRLNADGSRDGMFAGGDGVIETFVLGPDPSIPTSTVFNDITIDAVGRIVGAGNLTYRTTNDELVYQVLAARFDRDGLRDFDFADDGVFTTADPGATIRNVLIGPDGQILLVGQQMPTFWNIRGLVLWRLQEDGEPDLLFGTDGLMATIVTQDPMSSMWPGMDVGPGACSHAAILGSGVRLLVGGSAYTPNNKRVYTDVGALGRFLY